MTNDKKKELRKRIKEIVKYIWINEIKKDYDKDMLIGEDSFKNAFYYHIRNYLKYEIENYSLRIYTEYYVKEASSKADLVIAYLNSDKINELEKSGKHYCTKEAVEPLAVFELKYKSYSKGVEDFISDINKVKEKYMSSSELYRCDYYLAFISEYDHGERKWIDKSCHKNSKLIELTAVYNYETEEMDWQCH